MISFALTALAILSLAIATKAFLDNRPLREDIGSALSPERLKVPERMTSYDADILNRIALKLKSTPAGAHGTMLDLYVRPVLVWNDIIFAASLAAFSTSLWIWIAVQFKPAGLLFCLVALLAASSVLYGIFDISEDVALFKLLGKADQISQTKANAACWLTRLKLITILISVAGALVFEVLQWLPVSSSSKSANR